MISSKRRQPSAGLVGWVIALVAMLSIGFAPAAQASPDDDIVRDLTISYELDASGVLHVTETFQWDFGDRDGLGFYRSLVNKMGYEPDPTKERILEYSDFQVSSPSGAPAEVWVDDRTATEIVLAIGAPDGSSDTRNGVQTYVLSYQVRGAINAIRGQAGVADADELYYNVFSNSPNRVERVEVNVTGPAEVIDQACYQGPSGSTTPCDSFTAQGDAASYSASDLARRDGLSIMAAFPPGTFSDPGPILVDRPVSAAVGDFVGSKWPFAAGGWAVLLAALGFARVRRGRDRVYTDLTQGTLPQPGQTYTEATLATEPPIVTRPVPPEGLRPAEAIVIAEETTSETAHTATMIDLAVRGFYTIESLPYDDEIEEGDWQLTRGPQATARDGLHSYEAVMLDSFFTDRHTVRISDMRDDYQANLKAFSDELTAHVDRQDWFTSKGLALGKGGMSTLIGAAGTGVVVFGALGALAFTFPNFAGFGPLLLLIAGALLALTIVLLATGKAAHGRTALGRAHYEQIRGFREHLGSVEGRQLRWETGDDIFSDYLPWAVGFDLTERWVGIFEELSREGRYTMMPAWYIGSTNNFADEASSIGDSVGGGMSSSLGYTPGSSGGSGSFSGGGGFSGGGVGGGSFGGR